MQFSLLTPPTEIPNRMPLSRGLPSASAMAVDTRALPRALQLPDVNRVVPPPINFAKMDVDAAALPYQALARYATVGRQVSEDLTQVSNMILTAEAKKREVKNNNEIDSIYTRLVEAVDADFEKLKITTTDDTFRPAFNIMWAEHAGKHKEQASNPDVRAGLEAKFNAYYRTKLPEVSDVARTKFASRDAAELTQTVTDLTAKAHDPTLPPAQQELHRLDLESKLLKAASSGLHTPESIQKMRQQSMDTIYTERAKSEAFVDPIGVLERLGRGNRFGLEDSQRVRSLAEYAESRARTLRSDQEHLHTLQRQKDQAQQSETAKAWRVRITESHQPGAVGKDWTMEINRDSRNLSETDHAQLLEMNRGYLERASKPVKVTSDKATVGLITTEFRSGRVSTYTDQDLLRLLNRDVLDEADHRYLSGLRAQIVAQQKAEAEKPEKTDPVRKQQIEDGEKNIEELLQRGNRFAGTTEAQQAQVLVRDAQTEYHRLLRENPTVDPDELVTQVVERRIMRAEKLGKALPYKTKEDVVQAVKSGELTDKRTATRYYRLLQAMEKGKPAAVTAPTPTPPPEAPGIFQRFRDWVAPGESPVRAPVTP